MDVPAAPRPHSNTQRPTQAYYVPRKLLECGRGPQSKASSIEKNDKPVQTSAQQKQKPRPLMEHVISTPPTSLKEKSGNQASRQKSNSQNKSCSSRKSPPTPTVTLPYSSSSSSPRDLHLVSSTPSSRSSSSMSSGISSPSLTISTPRILNVKGGPHKYALPRPNQFAPMIAKSDEKECICDRNNTHVVCKRCGYECVGRVQVTCGQHPLMLALNDLRECPNPVCHSVQLLEIDDITVEDVHDDTVEQLLAEPIQKIDLLSD